MPDVEEPSFDASLIRDFCLTDDIGAREGLWEPCLQSFSSVFDPDIWLVTNGSNPFGAAAHSNLYNVECGTAFREWLGQNHVSEDEYATHVGPTQYVVVQAQLRSLSERARGNKGWAVKLMGFPAVGVIATGIGTHYQGTQNHNLMGQAAERLRERALQVLTGDASAAMETYPSATAAHWDERGLMDRAPVLHIGDLDISTFDSGQGAKLRMVRNTTVKKELSAFFAISGLTHDEFEANGEDGLRELHMIASALGTEASS